MGRRKITIRQITDPKLKHITFNKRKNGLIKKACELSLLCNVNMLLVFEDGAGNLIQFSRNRINGINSFFQECKYSNILELTSKEYPNFFKVNHYKKTKNAEKSPNNDMESNEADPNINQGEYQLTINDIKQGQIKPSIKDLKVKDILKRTNPSQQIGPMFLQQMKAEMNGTELERPNLTNDNRLVQENPEVHKKNKGKPNLHLNNLSNAEENSRQQKTPPNENHLKSLPIGDINEAIHNPYGAYKKDPYQDDQSKHLDKAMDYNATQFMQPNMDPLKRLGGVSETMPSPFNFYPTNNRLRPFNNFGLNPFTNEDAINSMLKGYPPFAFQMSGNPAFMGKPQAGGEIDDKLLDTAKMQNYLSQAGALLNRHHNIFNFPQGDFSKMNPNDPMRQANGRPESEYHNGYVEDQHEDFPVMFKGDPRFESGIPPANMNNRRYTSSDAYFSNFEDEYAEKKKFKHN